MNQKYIPRLSNHYPARAFRTGTAQGHSALPKRAAAVQMCLTDTSSVCVNYLMGQT